MVLPRSFQDEHVTYLLRASAVGEHSSQPEASWQFSSVGHNSSKYTFRGLFSKVRMGIKIRRSKTDAMELFGSYDPGTRVRNETLSGAKEPFGPLNVEMRKKFAIDRAPNATSSIGSLRSPVTSVGDALSIKERVTGRYVGASGCAPHQPLPSFFEMKEVEQMRGGKGRTFQRLPSTL